MPSRVVIIGDAMRSVFIKCECHGEALSVLYDEEDNYYYFSYWSQGFRSGKLPWRERIRYCWHILTKGEAYADEVILDQKSVEELVAFLNKKWSKE